MHFLALCGLIPCRIKLFFLFLFDVFTSRIFLFSFLLIDIYYMSECAADNKNLFQDMRLLCLVTVYSTINVRVNNYCVALFLARKKRPFGRFCFVISYVHSEHNVYLFTYFVASSREKLNFFLFHAIW